VTFDEALERHLRAVRERDEATLVDTVDDDEIVLVTAEGEVTFDPDLFVKRHRDWFDDGGWRLDTEVLHKQVGADLATALVRLDYHDAEGATHPSVLHLVFRRDGERWLMVQDQNTPIR
jgi:ketosteroid isomerase-like protein